MGVYLIGSFALGAGDTRSDVDFLVVSRNELTTGQERGARSAPRDFPRRQENWARHLEGSWVSAAAPRDPVGAHGPWLYVDNGASEMERSSHDDNSNTRWVLREYGLAVTGPAPESLLGAVDPEALRSEAAAQARVRSAWLAAHPESFDDGWAQPYAVLTFCRLLFTVEHGVVASKSASAAWAREALAPEAFHDLVSAAVVQRAHPFDPAGDRPDPRCAAQPPAFVAWAVEEILWKAP